VILASRDARYAAEASALAAYMAQLTCTPAWNNQCGNDFPRGSPGTSEEAYCDAYIQSCLMDAGGSFNLDTDQCENYIPWSVNPAGERIPVDPEPLDQVGGARVGSTAPVALVDTPPSPGEDGGDKSIYGIPLPVILALAGALILWMVRR